MAKTIGFLSDECNIPGIRAEHKGVVDTLRTVTLLKRIEFFYPTMDILTRFQLQ